MDNSMSGFSDRRKAFEAKYLHDEDLKFKIHTKCNHLFAIWVVSILGYKDEKANLYIEEILIFEIQKTQNKSVIEKVINDLEKAKVIISENRIRKEFERCWEEAYHYIMSKEEMNQ